jgi:peroxiredoxin
MALSAGSKAPDFTLKSKQGGDPKDVKLSDNFGKKKTVLLFFPLAFTGVCTKEFCDVSAGLSAYEKLEASVYGISVDSPFAQEAWAEKEKIKIPLLSDLNKEVSKKYGTLLPDLIGLGSVSARAAFVIDKAGVIQYSEQTPTPLELPDFKKIQAALSAC